MWLSKSKTSCSNDTSNKQTPQRLGGSGSQQHDLLSKRKRRRWEASDENLDNCLSVSEKPSTAKKTKATTSASQYEDDVSDDEYVIIDLFSSDESDNKTESHKPSSQKKNTPIEHRNIAANSQVSPIYNTSSIFKKFQNQSETKGARSSRQDFDDELMFTQDAGDTDLPEISWPKRRTHRQSQIHSSASSQSQGSQSSKRNQSMSQIVQRVISDIHSSSSDSEDFLDEKIVTLKRHAKEQCPDSKSNPRNKSSIQVMNISGDSLTALKPRPNKLPISKKKPDISSDSFSDFVILETSNTESSSDEIPTNKQKSSNIANSTTSAQGGVLCEKNNNFDCQIGKHKRPKDVENALQSKSSSDFPSRPLTKPGRKDSSFLISDSSAADSELPKQMPISGASSSTGRKEGEDTHKLTTSAVVNSRKPKMKKRACESYSDEDISCHTSESEEEYQQPHLRTAPIKSNSVVSSSDEETQEYQYERSECQTKAPTLAPSSLIVSQTAKEKLKKVVSAAGQIKCKRSSTQDDDTQEYHVQDCDNRNFGSLGSQTAGNVKHTNKTKSEPGSKTLHDEIDDELTQPPDTLFDSQEGDDSDIMVIGLDEDITQPMEEDDEELTQEPSQTAYGNPPELSLVDAMVPQKFASNISDIDPPILTQQISKSKATSCVKPSMVETASTSATFADSDKGSRSCLKKIESRSGGSTESNTSENCLLFKPVNDSNQEGEKSENRSGFHKKSTFQEEPQPEDTKKGFTDIPNDFETIEVKKEGVKIKQEKDLEFPSKLPCYTQEEDVIFVYDSSDDEALIDLSQTNIRSDHISDTDSMFDVFDHSDTELFDLDFGEDEDVTLVNDSDDDRSLDDIAEEGKNPFDHLGESDESDEQLTQRTTTSGKKGTFNFESVSDDSSEHADVQISSKPQNRTSIYEISSDSEKEDLFPPEHRPSHSMSVSKVQDAKSVEDLYHAETQVDDNAEDSYEMLEWGDKPVGVNVVPNNKQSAVQQYPLTSDNSVFSALTEVDDCLGEKNDKSVKQSGSRLGDKKEHHKEHEIQAGSSTGIPKVSRGRRVSFDMMQEPSVPKTDDSFLSDEDLYMAATQMDASVSEAISLSKAVVSSVRQKTEPCQDQRTCSQEKKKRKTASVKSVVMSSANVEIRPSVFRTPSSSKFGTRSIGQENIFDVDTQVDSPHLPSTGPSKTSTPKPTDVKVKSLFAMTKLNFQKLYSAQTQSMSSSIHTDSTTAYKPGPKSESESDDDDDALYRALDDLEETNLSCLNTTGLPEKEVHHKVHMEDVYGTATQVQPETKRRVSQEMDVYATTTQVQPETKRRVSQEMDVYATTTQVQPETKRRVSQEMDVYGTATQVQPETKRRVSQEMDVYGTTTQVQPETKRRVSQEMDVYATTTQVQPETKRRVSQEMDVYGTATQVQPETKRRVSQEMDVYGTATQIDPASQHALENLHRSSDKEVPASMDVDPFDVLTQVDEPYRSNSPLVESLGKGALPEQRRESADNFPKSAQSVMKRIMSKHNQRKSIMVCPDNSKVSKKTDTNKQEVKKKSDVSVITKSKFYKATPQVKTTWLSKKVPPLKTVPQKTSRFSKKKNQKSEDVGFSLTQKIQAAKQHQKERSRKTAVDPMVPTAKMKPAALHTSNSDVILPDEEEIMAKGLPLLTFNKLVEKHKPEKEGRTSDSVIQADEPQADVDMEVENITSTVMKNNVETLPSCVLKKNMSHVCEISKDRVKSVSPKPSSSKSCGSSSKHSSKPSHTSHSSHSKSESGSSKVKSSSSKSSSSKTSSSRSSKSTSNSSKSTSSSSKSTSRSAHPASSSTRSSSGTSKSSSQSSPASGSSSISGRSSTHSSSRSSGSVKPSPLSQNRLSVVDKRTSKDLVPPKTVQKESFLNVLSKAASASTPPPERASPSAAASTKPTKETSFDLSLYPLPAKVGTTPTPLAGPGKENKGESREPRASGTAFTLRMTEFHTPVRLSTPPPAHHPNDLPPEKLLRKLSENDPRKASQVRHINKSVPGHVSRDARGTSAQTSGQHENLLLKPPQNLLLKPSVATKPMGTNQRPRTAFRPIEPILPFSQMLRGSTGEHKPSMSAAAGVKTQDVVKDPSKLMEMTYYLQRVLAWNPLWLEEQCRPEFAGHPPPILKSEESVYPLLESYTSLEDYQTIMTRLLLMETWDMIFKEWKQKKVKTVTNVMFVSVDICNKQDKGGLSKFIWQGVLTRDQYRRGQHPLEGDLVRMNVWGSALPAQKDPVTRPPAQPAWKPFMGYVERMNVRPCDNAVNLFKTYPLLKCCVEKSSSELHLLTLTALGRYRKFKPISDRLMTLEPLCSLVSSRRQFQALTYLPRSPLLRDILHPSSQRVFHQDTRKPDPALLKSYNQSQAEAISAVCRAVQEPRHMPRICLLQGPPGTGKTHTITGIITKIIQDSKGQCCVCLCTPSNGAADELMRRLVALRNGGSGSSSMRLVRFGKVNSIHPDVQEYSYDELVNTERAKEEKRKRENSSALPDSVRQEQQQLRQRIEKVKNELDTISRSGNKIQIDRRQADLRKYEKELRYLDKQQCGPAHHSVQLTHSEETRIRQRVLQDAHVICGTLSSFGSARIMNILRTNNHRNPFLCAIIDEATQSTELDCLIPLQYGVSKLVMVGDPEQLPPTVISQKAKDMKFGLSLFERLYTYFKSKDQNVVLMLKTQYRMDPAILSFPNLYVYDGQLNTDSSVDVRVRSWPLLPYLVFNIEDGQEQSSAEGSVSNQAEANCVAEFCHHIISRSKIPATRIGVICPYQSQRSLVNSSLSNKRVRDVEVGTVDGFQGREKHVIIMSCVRARSSDGSIGFLSDRRRMNVALTRAKYSLYILGHLDTLKRGQDWRSLIDDAKRREVVVSVPAVNNFSTMAMRCFKSLKASH